MAFLAVSLFLANFAASTVSLGCDSDASSSDARLEESQNVASAVSSRLPSGLFLASADGGFKGFLLGCGGAPIFFGSSSCLGDRTSFSMALTRDSSFGSFGGIVEPGGGGCGSVAEP